ncbi:SDR family oxidoreductase [Neolewinella litorea]|uniref:SDR family oxidoreductase n=1 Tax=Neolewinella litorea TaxID=2562452 RepID=A0A4S4NG82_9BACT|nr:SDR family oxidoreductase [Neolewinella litorea]THH37825.1 SDR family oxidoreductase [Neolewinella litorea]
MKDSILVTGVSSGIGLTTARYLLDRGFQVYGSVRRGAGPEELTREPAFTALNFDVTDRDAIRAGVQRILDDGARLVGVVNNAGIAVSGPVETVREAEYRRQFEVNVFGLVAVIQETLPLLHASREGGFRPRIVNISSVSGYLTSPFTTFYSASKFAVEALTDGLRRELLDSGIDVISVAPGPVKTPIWSKGREQTDAFEDNRYSHILPKLGPYTEAAEASGVEPEVVAEAIYRALTDETPEPGVLVMNKRWMAKLLRLTPKRFQDKFFNKRLAHNRRY